MKHQSLARLLAMLAAAGAGLSHAATATIYADRAAFLSALGTSNVIEQDFESYPEGSNLSGVEFLPGLTASTNLDRLVAATVGSDRTLQALPIPRGTSEARYTFDVGGNYRALGFDLEDFDPATPGPGFLDFHFTDGDLTYTFIPIFPLNTTAAEPLFFGVISDTPLTRIVWTEGPESDGETCCETTVFDNFIAPAPVPVPAGLGLLASGIFALPRRRKTLIGS